MSKETLFNDLRNKVFLILKRTHLSLISSWSTADQQLISSWLLLRAREASWSPATHCSWRLLTSEPTREFICVAASKHLAVRQRKLVPSPRRYWGLQGQVAAPLQDLSLWRTDRREQRKCLPCRSSEMSCTCIAPQYHARVKMKKRKSTKKIHWPDSEIFDTSEWFNCVFTESSQPPNQGFWEVFSCEVQSVQIVVTQCRQSNLNLQEFYLSQTNFLDPSQNPSGGHESALVL